MSHIMRIRVNGRLSVVYGALEKAENEGVEILDCIKEEETSKLKRHHKYVDGVKDKGIKGWELALSKMPISLDDLKIEFTNHRFAASSAASVASQLMKTGKITKNKNGKYQLVKE